MGMDVYGTSLGKFERTIGNYQLPHFEPKILQGNKRSPFDGKTK